MNYLKKFLVSIFLLAGIFPTFHHAENGVADLRLSTTSVQSDWHFQEIISAWLTSRIPEGIAHITPQELRAKQLRKDEFMLIDARHRSAYDKKHIASAVSVLIWKDPEHNRLNINIPVKTEMVVYCQKFCKASARVLEELWEKGYRNLKYLSIGPKEWDKLGYPVEGTAVNK